MNRKEKLAKLRKCLALSQSANEHEAALALEKARQMMAELGLSEADATFLHVEERATRGSRCLRPAKWEMLLVATVSRAIGCSRFINADLDWQFVGRGAASEIAAYAFQVLYRQLKAARTAYIRTTLRRCKVANKRRRADAFCEGWASAVFVKVKAMAPAFDDELVGRYLAERHPDLFSVTTRSAKLKAAGDDFYNGVAGGHRVELNRGMEAATTPMLTHA